jgi:hypothetical protein
VNWSPDVDKHAANDSKDSTTKETFEEATYEYSLNVLSNSFWYLENAHAKKTYPKWDGTPKDFTQWAKDKRSTGESKNMESDTQIHHFV